MESILVKLKSGEQLEVRASFYPLGTKNLGWEAMERAREALADSPHVLEAKIITVKE